MEDETQVNIEVQVRNQHNIEQRSLFYRARLYQDPLLSGEDYMTLHRTVGINLLGYSTLPQEDFHSVYGLYNPDSRHRLTDDIQILNNTKRRPAHCRGVFLCAICVCIGEILFLQ